MPKIIIHRKRDWSLKIGSASSNIFEVFLNGKKIGYLSNGETNEFEVPTGQHTLKVKMGWYGSKNLECKVFNKDSKSFTVHLNYILISLFIIAILCIVLIQNYLIRIHQFGHHGIWYFLGSIILITAFYYIIGRNNYLVIREDGVV